MRDNIEAQSLKIIELLNKHSEGLSRGQILEYIDFSIHEKTLQRRLTHLARAGRIVMHGNRKSTQYYPANSEQHLIKGHLRDTSTDIFSSKSLNALKLLEIPHHKRQSVSYKRELLESYVPNRSEYVPKKLRSHLQELGNRFESHLAAGTYARQICERLLIDLTFNSSRLEGNTYSLLDTQKLIEEGKSAEGKVHEETVMIVNHKEAILFLVENAADISLNSFTIRNLHNLLSQDLLADPTACGKVREKEVNIGQSTYKPLNNPHQLSELFEQCLQKANRIENPFEQSFFILTHLSYLQAFLDVNKRTSRLSCNIPFIKQNLCPLSFTDVASDDYNRALLTLYEKQDFHPILDLFAWAYARSCAHYDVVKQSFGEIDPFRIHYRQQRKEVMGMVIRAGIHDDEAATYIRTFGENAGITEIDKFVAMTLADLNALHSGGIVGLGITELQLNKWLSTKK